MAANEGSEYTDPASLATVEDFTRRYPELVRDIEPQQLADILVEATSQIEMLSGRRLAPFTGHLFSDRLTGIDPNEYGGVSEMPTDIFGSLGMSRAASLGFAAADLVRHFWLDQFAPVYPELWTYNVQAITIYGTYGNTYQVDVKNGGIMGPEVTDGHVWLRLGTFSPEASRVRCLYDGGYTVNVPPSLRRAVLFQAAKFVILECEPQTRREMNLDEIDKQIEQLIGPWFRG